jgi:hypothetical protein
VAVGVVLFCCFVSASVDCSMLIKLKYLPLDGSAPPATAPLIGLKEDLPLSTQVPLICSKLGLPDFAGYALFRLPGGLDGPIGERVWFFVHIACSLMAVGWHF